MPAGWRADPASVMKCITKVEKDFLLTKKNHENFTG